MTTEIIPVGDIDIDCADRNQILYIIDHIAAKRTDGARHPTGVFVQDISFNPLTMLTDVAFDDKTYNKIDFLNLYFLKRFKSNKEIEELMNEEPDWDMLLNPNVVRELAQIHNRYDLVVQLQPKSLDDLMDLLHKIRETSDYRFKRSHSCAYALNIIVMLNYFRKYNTKFLDNSYDLPEDLFNAT